MFQWIESFCQIDRFENIIVSFYSFEIINFYHKFLKWFEKDPIIELSNYGDNRFSSSLCDSVKNTLTLQLG